MSKTKDKTQKPLTDTGRTLEQLMHSRILRMHLYEEDMLRWGKRKRTELSGYFKGYTKEQVAYIFENKEDKENNRFTPGLKDCKTLEEAEKFLEETLRPRAKAELNELRKYDKYSGMDDETLIQVIIDEQPSEEKALENFLKWEKESFTVATTKIKEKYPDLEIPLSIRYIDYVDSNVREMVKICRVSGACDYCYPYKKKVVIH